jgi:plasmid stability protein
MNHPANARAAETLNRKTRWPAVVGQLTHYLDRWTSENPACYHDDSTEDPMGQIIVRKLDDAVIKRLKQRAKKQGISLEEAVRRVLLESVKPNKDELLEEMRRIRAMSPPITKPPFSQDLIREDRDSR